MASETILKLSFIGLIAIAVLFEVAGDIFFKKWSVDNKTVFLYVGLLVYFIGTIFWAISLKYEYLSVAISFFTIFNLIVGVLVGVFYFKEDLSMVNRIGIAIGILSIFLIEA